MQDNVTQEQVGALIIFKNGVDKERVLKWVARLQELGVVEGVCVDNFDPAYGSPVWYVP